MRELSTRQLVTCAVCLLALLVACGGDGETRRAWTTSDLVANGGGYSFRRVTGKATESLVAQGFGERVVDEVVSTIARSGSEPVGPVDIMVLTEPVTPRDWVDRFYRGLDHDDISGDVGADAILFTGSAIGAVMECRREPEYILIRAVSTDRQPLVHLMTVLAERCA